MASRLAPALVVLACAAACAGDVSTDFDEVELGDLVDAKADGSSELRVRASDTTLWMRTHLTREDRDGADTFVLRGRASRNIEDGRGFVLDDVYGAFTQLAPRSFELAWTSTESRSLVQGVDQLIGLTLVESASRPTNMTARVVVRPRLTDYDGSEQSFGSVYADAAARDAALSAVIEDAIDVAYATPLELVEPYAPIPGVATRARHVAADALLAHLAEQRFEETALGRPLLVLAREYRARHVASVRAFRESIEPIDGLAPESDAYVGDWIGLYTEVELDRASQTVIRVLVEID